jgi:hypothetical protein
MRFDIATPGLPDDLRAKYGGGRIWTHRWVRQRELLALHLRAEIDYECERLTLVRQQICTFESQEISRGAVARTSTVWRCWHPFKGIGTEQSGSSASRMRHEVTGLVGRHGYKIDPVLTGQETL